MARKCTGIQILLIVSAAMPLSTAFGANVTSSLSTSAFIPIPSVALDGKSVAVCSGKKAEFGHSYVSIAIERMSVNRNDSFLYTVFNRNRTSFGSATLTATYNSHPLSVTKVGAPVALNGQKNMVDLGVGWSILDRTPWVIRDATFGIKLGYSADSTVDSTVTAFNGITSTMPGYTLSSSLAVGFAVTKAADSLLFGPSRAIDLLRAERSLPLMADQLCDGYYVIFAANDKSGYSGYSSANVVWSEQAKDLSSNNAAISGLSYVVVSVRVADSFYPTPGDAFNDSSKPWASKYQDVLSSLSDLAWVGTPDEVTEKEKTIRTSLTNAHTLLTADMDLTLQEKEAIHKYAQDEALSVLKTVISRVKGGNQVTAATTTNALNSLMSMNSKIFTKSTTLLIGNLTQDPTTRLPKADDNLGKSLNAAATSLRTVILAE